MSFRLHRRVPYLAHISLISLSSHFCRFPYHFGIYETVYADLFPPFPLILFVTMSILFYRRPDYIAKVPGPMNLTQCQIYVERTQKHKRAIPPELSFENVIQNRALPVRVN